MNVSLRELVKLLLESDRLTGGHPVLAEQNRLQAEQQLFELLSDRNECSAYLDALGEARRQIGEERPRHPEPLQRERLHALLREGPQVLSNEELAFLLVNALALSFAHDALMEWAFELEGTELNERWYAALETAGRRAAAEAGVQPDLGALFQTQNPGKPPVGSRPVVIFVFHREEGLSPTAGAPFGTWSTTDPTSKPTTEEERLTWSFSRDLRDPNFDWKVGNRAEQTETDASVTVNWYPFGRLEIHPLGAIRLGFGRRMEVAWHRVDGTTKAPRAGDDDTDSIRIDAEPGPGPQGGDWLEFRHVRTGATGTVWDIRWRVEFSEQVQSSS